MKDNNINEEWLEHDQWQPDMPSPDVAWSDMLARLEKEMPVNTVLESAGKKSFLQHKKLYLVIIMLLLLNINHTNENFHSERAQSYSEKGLPASAAISKSQAAIELNNNTTPTIAQENSLKSISSSGSNVPEMNRAGNKNYIYRVAPYIHTKRR